MRILFTLSFVIIIFACCNNNPTPKPMGYIRIDFPEKKYISSDINAPFSFEYPVYGKIKNDTDKNAEPYWYNIEFENYKGKIHLSYKPIRNNLAKYIEDTRKLAYKHTIKADAIEEKIIVIDSNRVFGILYDIKGNTASSVQFFVTDSIRHFLRGSLYFSSQPNKDSLMPVINFFRSDVEHLIKTLKWK